ncbi:hypothetical protein GOBAR_AA33374 [Gossypium barbadense]|uniref:Uncharacterized protein n=1 Tax=Gossypium barbadense TaxID=3634 RepID=A0A2P5W8E3_GOSBA|nr:hypothetical protein GOBAR_AA33374 [Gossypium barbadense]
MIDLCQSLKMLKIIEYLKDKLTKPFEQDEVEREIFGIDLLKAPGPDGNIATFFQQKWEVVGPLVTDAYLNYLNMRKMLKEMSKTFIVLVPKRNNLEEEDK